MTWSLDCQRSLGRNSLPWDRKPSVWTSHPCICSSTAWTDQLKPKLKFPPLLGASETPQHAGLYNGHGYNGEARTIPRVPRTLKDHFGWERNAGEISLFLLGTCIEQDEKRFLQIWVSQSRSAAHIHILRQQEKRRVFWGDFTDNIQIHKFNTKKKEHWFLGTSLRYFKAESSLETN